MPGLESSALWVMTMYRVSKTRRIKKLTTIQEKTEKEHTKESFVLEVKDLRTHIFNKNSIVKAVDGVSFNLSQGETLGIVGESGCGKTMTALSLLRLVPQPAGRIVSGEILLNGQDILTISEKEMRELLGRQISMILQDPQTLSLIHI